MQKLKNLLKSILKRDSFIYKFLKTIYQAIRSIKYNIVNRKQIKEKKECCNKQIDEAIKIIKNYKNENYIVFYNPTWLGVAASTKGLFENIVPLEQVYGNKNIKRISEEIVSNNIKSVIFSQMVEGWSSILKYLKKLNNNIKIKVIWHGNCYEFFSDYTWNLNKDVMNLYKQNKIDCFGFVRSTMYEFYKESGYNSYYLQNNVNMEEKKLEKREKSDKIKIGIYNADSRELKNIYTSIAVVKSIPNAVADIVPINEGAKQYADILGLEITYLDDYIEHNKLMERIRDIDLNIYPTFTENAPMFPLESFEIGVPCLIGNNNDYFENTKLKEFVVLDREDDIEHIKDKALNVLEHRDEIMNLYKEWKKEFNKKCEQLAKEFINA